MSLSVQVEGCTDRQLSCLDEPGRTGLLHSCVSWERELSLDFPTFKPETLIPPSWSYETK